MLRPRGVSDNADFRKQSVGNASPSASTAPLPTRSVGARSIRGTVFVTTGVTMLRISLAGPEGKSSTLRLEGQIIGPWVEELRKTAEGFRDNGHRVTLDLAEVTFADREGVALLARDRKSV